MLDRHRWLALLPDAVAAAAAVVALAGGPAHADPAPLLFVDVAPNICGGARDLQDRVARRARSLRFAEHPRGAAVARLVVSTPGGNAVEASLDVTGGAAAPWSRVIRAASCDDAFDAVAVVLVLALDRMPPPVPRRERASAGSRPPSPPGVEDRRVANASDAPGVLAEPEPAPQPQPPPAPRAPPEVVLVAPPSPAARFPPSTAPPPSVSIEAGGVAAGLMGAAPAAWPGFGGYVGLSRRGARPFPALVVQLGVTHHVEQTHATAGGDAAFSMTAATLALCPLALGWSVELRLCGTGVAGRLRATGTQTLMPESHTRPFAAAGAAVAVSVRLGAGISVGAMLGAAAPLVRDSFQFRPEVFHRVAPVLLTGGISCGVRFR